MNPRGRGHNHLKFRVDLSGKMAVIKIRYANGASRRHLQNVQLSANTLREREERIERAHIKDSQVLVCTRVRSKSHRSYRDEAIGYLIRQLKRAFGSDLVPDELVSAPFITQVNNQGKQKPPAGKKHHRKRHQYALPTPAFPG